MAHGMVDVNVHFQDIVRLSPRLIELGKKDWELAVYPSRITGSCVRTRGPMSIRASSGCSSTPSARACKREPGGKPGPVTSTQVMDAIKRAADVVRRVVGVPDYDRYVAHVRACHPGTAPMTREEFEASRLEMKYSRPGQRCC